MWTDVLLVSLWAGLVATDTTALLQIMISRPMVACSILGIILGNFQLGFTIGILLELLYISELPVGGANFAESNVGAVAAAAISILVVRQAPNREYIIVACALAVAILISWIGGMLVRVMRRINSRIFDHVVSQELLTPMHINLAQLAGIGMAYLLGFLTVLVSCVVFINVLPIIVESVPQRVDAIFHPLISGIFAVGCAHLVSVFWTQGERRRLFAVGIAVGIILILLGV